MAADLSRYLVIVLAAGLGKRLNPLTQVLPKPVIPLLGEPLCIGMIRQLANHGATTIHINSSYLSKTLESELQSWLGSAYSQSKKGSNSGDNVSVSKPELRFWHEVSRLETGGALLRIWQEFRAENPDKAAQIKGVFVVSGDLVGEVPIGQMLESWESGWNTPEARRPPQALIVTHKVNGPKSKGVWTRENNSIIAGFWGDAMAAHTSADCEESEFGGFYIIDPQALEGSGTEIQPGNVIDLVFRRILAGNGRILAMRLPDGSVWHNVGTPEEFFRCTQDLESRLKPQRFDSPSTLGRQPLIRHWSGECLEVRTDQTCLVNLINIPVQSMLSQPTRIAMNEFEQESFEGCLGKLFTAVEALPRLEIPKDAYSDQANGFPETQRDLHNRLIMQVSICSNALIQLPRPILIGGRLFLKLALSQRYPREASLEWLYLLIVKEGRDYAAYS
jgi:NDP-sugar pyrophosphorylase family protein